jgi:hypothetical protein
MCLDILENYAVPQVCDGYIFQQDGAPPRFWTPVTQFPNEYFTGLWISQGDCIPWPSILEQFFQILFSNSSWTEKVILTHAQYICIN